MARPHLRQVTPITVSEQSSSKRPPNAKRRTREYDLDFIRATQTVTVSEHDSNPPAPKPSLCALTGVWRSKQSLLTKVGTCALWNWMLSNSSKGSLPIQIRYIHNAAALSPIDKASLRDNAANSRFEGNFPDLPHQISNQWYNGGCDQRSRLGKVRDAVRRHQ